VQTHAGITFSDDKLLQTRVFSYADAQRYRLGVNYQELPINKPKCPFHANEYDGAMQMAQKDEEVDYWPSNFRKNEGPTNGATTKNTTPIQVRWHEGLVLLQTGCSISRISVFLPCGWQGANCVPNAERRDDL
jgi:catalase